MQHAKEILWQQKKSEENAFQIPQENKEVLLWSMQNKLMLQSAPTDLVIDNYYHEIS